MQEQHSSEQYPTGTLEDIAEEITEFSDDEARELFDEIARRNLGISGDEFRERWHRGDYDDDPDRDDVMAVVMSLPLVEKRRLHH